MVEKEKVVVILLVVTIILAVISMILTLGVNVDAVSDDNSDRETMRITNDDTGASIGVKVLPSTADSGGES